MNVRTDNDVTLSHADAERVALLLRDLASAQHDHARRTRSPAVALSCRMTAELASRLAGEITGKLWSWDLRAV